VFVHLTNRIARLSRYHACQLEFLGHCVVAAAAVYAARSEAVVKLFPDTVYASSAAVHGLLTRIGMTAPAPAAPAAGAAADKGGVRARPGKGTGAAATPAAEDTAGATGTAASAAPAADAVAASPAAAGLRKACIAFLHATSASLPGIEASIIADKESPQEDREYVQAQALAAKVAETLAKAPARAVVAEAGEALRAHASSYKGGMSSLYAFFAAPLLIVASLAGVALLWSPQLLPEAVLAHPLVAQVTRLQPQYEWVRYAGSAVAAAFVLLLLAQMVTYTGVQALPGRQASVHALLASDGDVAALLEGRAGDTPVDFALLGAGEQEGQKGKGKAAAKEEEAAAAPASGKGSKGGKKGEKGAGAAAASPSAGAGAEASPAAAAGGEEEDDGVDWCLSMGLPRETLDGMLWAFEHASSVQQSVEEHEAATAAAEEAAAAAADGAAAGAGAAAASTAESAGADAGAAASPAAAPAGAASASPPEQLVVDIPDGLLESLATLSLKLEELGETELAGQVMSRYSFVAGLLRANGYAIEGEEAGEGYAEGEGEGAEGAPAGEGEAEEEGDGAAAAVGSSGEGGEITAAATGAASE
jgi:SWI/SNF-related matrix-associated actin-dependent regulator 1 of chromatin subfamily A